MRTATEPLAGDIGRETSLAHIERAIASRWARKDAALTIGGLVKRPLGSVHGFQVYQIDSEWIRDNLDVTFGTGGHGLVHTFIPLREVWIDPAVEAPASLVFHELVEFHLMLMDSMDYAEAHNKALRLQAGRSLTWMTVPHHLTDALHHTEVAHG